ncbi:MAG: DinB family protein [Candidatus Eisenbacteria bacterium]|nr:DinB family protein [Candidatus Eisenbacteria bacterium]
MTAQDLVQMYSFSRMALGMNLEGLNHADSLVSPQPGGNCANWLLGHMIASREQIYLAVGAPRMWSEAETAVYDRGTVGHSSRPEFLPWDELLRELDRSQSTLLSVLGAVDQTTLDRATERGTIGSRVVFLNFHEAYHIGQVGLVRRLIGKEGAIQ